MEVELVSGERMVFGGPNNGKKAWGGSRLGEHRGLHKIPNRGAGRVACGIRSVTQAGLGRQKTGKWAGCVSWCVLRSERSEGSGDAVLGSRQRVPLTEAANLRALCRHFMSAAGLKEVGESSVMPSE